MKTPVVVVATSLVAAIAVVLIASLLIVVDVRQDDPAPLLGRTILAR